MKLKLVIAAVPLLVMLACGSDTNYTLSSGTYGLSNTLPLAPDNCNLGGPPPTPATFPDGTNILIAVSGSNATFSFGPGPTANPSNDPVATIQGNTINAGSKSHDYDNNINPPGRSFDCVETITLTVSGSLLANDQLQGTLVYGSVRKSGTACTTQNLGYKTFPCSSTLTFTAKKR